VNIREFGCGPKKATDDRPYGGGSGMVMMPEPIYRALKSIKRKEGGSIVILLSPKGERFDQALAWKLSKIPQLILICGRYEGVDERISQYYMDKEISIGDYILSGGEIPAMAIIETISRLIPGVLGDERSPQEDSFENHLLEYPQYTRPRIFEGKEVPDILLSGDHEKIRIWRKTQALKNTLERRPDLLEKAKLDSEAERILRILKKDTG
jgi:tRNA (guanine37-N1)-methyltransferase